MYLIQQLFTLLFNNIRNIIKLFTQLKVLEDVINIIKIKLTTDKQTLLVLSLALSAYYNLLIQI